MRDCSVCPVFRAGCHPIWEKRNEVNYADILWNGIQAEKVQRAFEKLNYREQTLLEKRLAICMTCGRVGSWKNGTAEIVRLADWDTIKTNWFANEAIRYILSLSPDALKKYMLVHLEPPLIS